MPDTITHGPSLFHAPNEPVLNTARAGRLQDAPLTLRVMAGIQTQRGQRDPTCLLPLIADVLEALAAGDHETARAELRRWVAMDRSEREAGA
jgi:cobalamin biosynthesis protein CobD/CbiB